ncbi:ORF6N domain-containing protein [Candidatus Woesearchaeota archaeon]|nr:ORF6N domain-containing protein [Candidatus Woesearchaeota archaeon]
MNEISIIAEHSIKDKIHTIRESQVMLDRDLAELYGVSTKRLNEQVRRNIARFPKHFMFRLSKSEYLCLRSQNANLERNENVVSQNVIPKSLRFQNATSTQEQDLRSQNATTRSDWGGRRTIPYVFTEQGVSMLSTVLKSKTAVKVSIQIIDAFVAMRKFISKNAELFQRLDNVDQKHIEYDKKFEKVFDTLESRESVKRQGIFYNGQVFDAHRFISDLIRTAEKSIILIDNYVDDSVLTLFSKKKKIVRITIFTKHISKQLRLDLEKYNSQHSPITIKEFKKSHDRFLIIDDKIVYHIGASLKDLGKKWFAFSRFDKDALELLAKLR